METTRPRKSRKDRAGDGADSAKNWVAIAEGKLDDECVRLAKEALAAFDNAYYAFDACTANGGRNARCSALRRKGAKYMAEGEAALKEVVRRLAGTEATVPPAVASVPEVAQAAMAPGTAAWAEFNCRTGLREVTHSHPGHHPDFKKA